MRIQISQFLCHLLIGNISKVQFYSFHFKLISLFSKTVLFENSFNFTLKKNQCLKGPLKSMNYPFHPLDTFLGCSLTFCVPCAINIKSQHFQLVLHEMFLSFSTFALSVIFKLWTPLCNFAASLLNLTCIICLLCP